MAHSNKIFDRFQLTKRRTAALQQDDYPDFLDKLIALELVSRLDLIERQFETCLVLGQPAPLFLTELSKSGKVQNIIGQSAQFDNHHHLAFDSEWLPFKEDCVDCIIAPPGLEMVNDLPGTLIQINRALKPDGLFLGAMFGGLTLSELRHAWVLADEEITGGASPRVAPFIDVRQAGNLLQRAGMALPVADADVFTVRYDSAIALMLEIKKMGLTNSLRQRARNFTSRRLLELVDKNYSQIFADPDGRIRATVEINYLTAWSPHESQQKPLQPGSATTSLAEVFSNSATTNKSDQLDGSD